jgi:ABC-2 type transport system ATP-binding protein
LKKPRSKPYNVHVMPTNVIEIKGLTKSYKNVSVLKGLDLEVEQGTMLALLGPNGAGKTTTVRILSTLLAPDTGSVRVAGFDVVKDGHRVRSNIGLTGQYAAVDEFLTGRENLEMMGRLYHLSAPDSQTRATELLNEFEIADAADRAVKTYSGGMRRRLDLALSLIATPPILFLDEPTTGLDPRSRLKIWDIIGRLLASGVTILLTTQYLEEADKLADKIAVLDQGKIIAIGTADELKEKAGRERLEIMVEEGYDFDKAVQIIGGEDVRLDKENRTVNIEAEGTVAHIQRILNAMEKAGIEVETLSLHKPTLDDVFLKLTGHGAADDTSEDAKDKKHD